MKKSKLLLLCCIMLSGCVSEPATDMETTATEGVMVEVTTSAAQAEVDLPVAEENEVEIQIPNAFTTDVPNPYSGYSESSTPWKYDLFEIARGSQYLNFDESLEYKRDYAASTVYELEEYNGLTHKYSCTITLPQATGDEQWVSQINYYYQQLMPELIAEGDIIWEENIGNTDMKVLSYYYEESFQYGNVVNVVRSRCNYGFRPSVGHDPFADMFSAIDGQPIMLDDLFCVDKEVYMPVLHSSLANASLCFANYYDSDRNEDFKVYPEKPVSNFDRASVAVTSFGLVFIYPTGSAASMAESTVFLKVSYDELEGMLNPTYFPE